MFWEWVEDRLRQMEWAQRVDAKLNAFASQSVLHKLIVVAALFIFSVFMLLAAFALVSLLKF